MSEASSKMSAIESKDSSMMARMLKMHCRVSTNVRPRPAWYFRSFANGLRCCFEFHLYDE